MNLELLTDNDMLLMVEKGIEEEISSNPSICKNQ